jgi:hypothetical protein
MISEDFSADAPHASSTCLEVLEFLRPKPCPSRLIRIGGIRDGAYLVPDDLEGISACFSPGVNNIKEFEDELSLRYGLKCHMCDFSSAPERFRTPLVSNLQTFQRKWLRPCADSESITLEQWVNELTAPTEDLMLQMDIEGAEYENLLATNGLVLSRFRIIVLELHGFSSWKKTGSPSAELLQLSRKLQGSHVCVHAHPNNVSGDFIDSATGRNIPFFLEITLLRKDRFNVPVHNFFPVQLPNPLDIPRNSISRKPLHLNEKWLVDSRPDQASKLKSLEDKLDYLIYMIENNVNKQPLI